MGIEIVRDLLILTFTISISFIVNHKSSLKNWFILLLFLAIGFMDNFLHSLTTAYPESQILKSHIWNNYLVFNWSAKFYSIAFVLITLVPLRRIIGPKEIGLTIIQKKDSIRFSLLFLLLLIIVSSLFGIISRDAPYDTETLFYTATMPGLSEELIYRGLLLGLLNRFHNKKFILLGTSFGWGAIITSILFGLLHGMQLTEGLHFQFDFITIILTGIYGFIFALLKERSGSLVFPVIAHGATDFLNFFFRMI